MFDLAKLRQDTPSTKDILHFNNAGSSLTPKPVQDYLIKYLESDATLGGYETADLYQADLDNFYKIAAKVVNGHPDEIAFLENATRAWDMVFYAFGWKPGDILLTSEADYNSNMVAYLHAKDRYGLHFILIPDDEYGQIDVAALEAAITPSVKLISISHIPTNSGLVNPVKEIGAVAKKHNIPFLLDACQSVGQMPIDRHQEGMGCTMLSTTGRKYIRGPRGTDFLWVRSDWISKLNPPLLDNFAAPWVSPNRYEILPTAKRFENWERYFGGQAALGKALEYYLELGPEAAWEHTQMLATKLRVKLSMLNNVTLWDPGQQKCGLVTFTKEGVDPAKAKIDLRKQGIHISSSGTQLLRQDQQKAGIANTIRASVHYYNTDEEVDRFVAKINSLQTD